MECCCPSDCLLPCLLWSRPCCTMSYAVTFPLARLNTSVDRALFLTASSDHLRLVRLRKNAYLQLSLFVAQYEEYRPHLIQHLVDRKVIHWDTVIRQLTSQVLTNTSQPDLLEADLIRSVLHAVAKQSTEQIRRNRLLAPNFFSSLVYCDPTIPHIEQLEELRSIIQPPPLDISTEKECFDLWMKVMRLDHSTLTAKPSSPDLFPASAVSRRVWLKVPALHQSSPLHASKYCKFYTFTTKPHFTTKKSPSGTSPRSKAHW
ncbi:hypothetical protein DAPPUDRAFT_118891 [Daphnia pulex]|uniref:Tubulin-folding cofactor D C-terminal domain-containing protein n=1 Tax=Daphnia pulex TaxID=6669 RepID=E9HWZ0_DAPPU|nr:hypothetical protein DAPPUDRAFT_118891 [Daphnia pulex]|eukprot:EFX63738.1 hypothetical protein DAPPUDRAFT_118891 [Daphnia pulex]